MAAAATAPRRRPAPRRAPARRTATSRRSKAGRATPSRRPPARQARPRRPNKALASAQRAKPLPHPDARRILAGAAMVPVAAVRTAGAVRDLSESSLILRLTRGRGWIAVLGTLLFGIVTLNVISLSLSAGSGLIGQQVAELERENSALRAELAEGLSASRVEGEAARLGLAVPDPEDVGYLTAEDGDAERLADLLEQDTLLSGSPSSTEVSSATSATPAPESPAPEPVPETEAAAPAAPSGGESASTGSSGGGTAPSAGGGVGL